MITSSIPYHKIKWLVVVAKRRNNMCHTYRHDSTCDKNLLGTSMVITQKSSKKRPAPTQGGPKPKKLHVEAGKSKADNKRRSRPVTQPLDARDPDSESDEDLEEDDIDVEEDVDHEKEDGKDGDGDESPMQVDSRIDEYKIPKDPNGLSVQPNFHKSKEGKLNFVSHSRSRIS